MVIFYFRWPSNIEKIFFWCKSRGSTKVNDYLLVLYYNKILANASADIMEIMKRSAEELFDFEERICRQMLDNLFYIQADDDTETHYNKPYMQMCARYAFKSNLSLACEDVLETKEVTFKI